MNLFKLQLKLKTNEKWSFIGFQGSYQESIPESTSFKINWEYLCSDKAIELIQNKNNKEATNSTIGYINLENLIQL